MTATTIEAPATIETPVRPPADTLPETLEVIVTNDDIRDGWQRSATNCPVALATRRAMEYAEPYPWVSVFHGFVALYGPSRPQVAYSSPEFRDWVEAFDRDRASVAPERFVLQRTPN